MSTLKLVTILVGGNNIQTVLVGGNNATTGVCFHVLCEKAHINPLENLYKNDKSFQILTLKLVTIHVGGNNIETVLVGGNNAKTGVCIYVLCKKAPIDPLENLYKTEK